MTAIVQSRQADQIEAIRSACVSGDGIDPLDEATTLRINHHGLSPHDRLWVHGNDGFLLSISEPGTELKRRDITLAVAPDARLRGTATSLLRACLDSEPTSVEYFAWSHGDHPAAATLARSTGFERARALWVMRRAVDRSGWSQPHVPTSGISIRSYRPDDAAALLEINAAAFADHPEQGGMDTENLAERMASAWFDPADLLVAVDDTGQMLGFHWTKIDRETIARTGRLVGEVYVIGVSPAAHGQGIGRQLMEAGLDHLARAGSEQIILYVEATNAPALALYESLGFTHDDRDTHVLYRRAAHPTAGP